MNGECLVARFEVDGVEHPNLVEADDVPKIPTGNHIRIRDGRKRDMKQVIANFGGKMPCAAYLSASSIASMEI